MSTSTDVQQQKLTNTVIMITPVDFEYNIQTAQDNEFMNEKNDKSAQQILQTVSAEFEDAVRLLRSEGVHVIEFDKREYLQDLGDMKLPDAVFPNNWISTDTEGNVILYPMYAKNRSMEKNQFPYIIEKLYASNFLIRNVSNFSYKEQVLEGTGTLVLDHQKRRAYCSFSQRAQHEIFEEWCKQYRYKPIGFEAQSSKLKPIYHTNVVLSVGDRYAVICAESIFDVTQREFVLSKLSDDREVVLITLQQAEKNFCGNLLQLLNSNGESLIVMSQSAFDGFTEEQRSILSKYGKLVALKIPLIEEIGGGSARCMLAEVFLPKVTQLK